MGTAISLNRKLTDPNMSDLLDMFKKEIFLSFNCHAVAIVQAFDPDKQTLSATIAYKKSFLRAGPDGVYRMELVDYPVLIDVPVWNAKGGKAALTMPIAQGDECVILFNDRDIDNWFQSGQVTGVASGRLHSSADGIAFVGLQSTPNFIAEYDAVRAVLRNDTAMVGVGPTLIKIANGTTTLNTLLQSLMTDISTLNTTLNTFMVAMAAVPAGPVVGPSLSVPGAAATAALAPLIASLATLATNIAGLLE